MSQCGATIDYSNILPLPIIGPGIVAMNKFQEDVAKQQRLYTSSSDYVRPKGLTEVHAASFYADYANFVLATTRHRQGRLLDVGCGNGWSSSIFAKSGYDVVGVDLNPDAFEPTPSPNLSFKKGSALEIPFPAACFDVVASYQMIEHVPDPELALTEMLRVTKPGGTISIVSPNILSILASFRAMTRYVWKNRPLRTILFRRPGMPRHPWGNTLPELIVSLCRNCVRLTAKLIARKPCFSMREPDLNPPFHSDNDACYVCNPIDLVKFFRCNGCRVLQNGKPGRPPLSWLVTTGAYITIMKV
jgi:2-polyprenyl-3-methyl-5-hydroxy-6-metoxy-1,4-benzoquinol methylase